MTQSKHHPRAVVKNHRFHQWVLPFFILLTAAAGAGVLHLTRPRIEATPKREVPPTVTVTAVHRGNHQVSIFAMGTVIPSHRLELRPQVEGQIVAVHDSFVEGGVLPAGSILAEIDSRDYDISRRETTAAVIQARSDMALEQGRQVVAVADWESAKISSNVNKDLALRKPHLEKFQAALDAARAKQEGADLALQRTKPKAPFPLLVLSRSAVVGSRVGPMDSLGTFVGTDSFWIRAAVPVDRLSFIQFPNGEGGPSRVQIRQAPGLESTLRRTGRVFKLLGELEPNGRMANILIEVPDPLNLKTNSPENIPLLLGARVRVNIQGRILQDVFAIPRSALRADNTVWLVRAGRLVIQPVEVAWRTDDEILISSGLKETHQLIVSRLSSPIAGMPLQMERASDQDTASEVLP